MSPWIRVVWLAKRAKFFKKIFTILVVIPFGIRKLLTKENFFGALHPTVHTNCYSLWSETESTVLVADALPTRPLIGIIFRDFIFVNVHELKTLRLSNHINAKHPFLGSVCTPVVF